MPFIVKLKNQIGEGLDLSDKALHAIVGLALFFLFLRLLKRPGRALLAVLAIELVNEINDVTVAYPSLTRPFWVDTLTDIAATMLLPILVVKWTRLSHQKTRSWQSH